MCVGREVHQGKQDHRVAAPGPAAPHRGGWQNKAQSQREGGLGALVTLGRPVCHDEVPKLPLRASGSQ